MSSEIASTHHGRVQDWHEFQFIGLIHKDGQKVIWKKTEISSVSSLYKRLGNYDTNYGFQSMDKDVEDNYLPVKIVIEIHTPDQYLTTTYLTPTHLSPIHISSHLIPTSPLKVATRHL